MTVLKYFALGASAAALSLLAVAALAQMEPASPSTTLPAPPTDTAAPAPTTPPPAADPAPAAPATADSTLPPCSKTLKTDCVTKSGKVKHSKTNPTT